MKCLVCYDVSDDRRRRRLEACVRHYAQRVQWSVYVADVSLAQLTLLWSEIEACIDAREDSVRLYQVCDKDAKKVVLDGVAEIPWTNENVVID